MSVLFQAVINTGKLYPFRKSLNLPYTACKCLVFRKYSDAPKKFALFDEVVAQRRAEARRSLVVQVNSESSFTELYGYCSQYSDIKGIHHYNNSSGEHFMLIEFGSEENLKDVLQSCSAHQKDLDVMSLQSPFLWFRAVQGKKVKVQTPPEAALATSQGNSHVNEDTLFEELMHCSTVSDQIQLLHDRTVLNDVGVRLRYMVARQLEVIFASLYSNIEVRLFGSSVNGFGKMGCDLDLVLTNPLSDEKTDSSRRLVYHEKRCEGGRGWQRHLELVASLLELKVPGAARVTRILNARVPIVKYTHELTGVECDVCYSNMSGVYMSELLWLYGSLDARVRPLAVAVRAWARTAGLTPAQPGRWITNFPLTLMVLFFLQQRGGAGVLLPPHRLLLRLAGKEDVRIADENLNCTFLRDMNRLPPTSYGQSTANLEELLLQFFEFYAQFDFQEKAISINEGVAIRKPNGLPLYIVNPLEQSLNVSRNVSYEECERIKLEVRNAAWQLETVKQDKTEDWGLLSLIEKRSTRGLKKLLRVGNSHRLVSMKDLFKEEEESRPDGEEVKTKLQRLSKAPGETKTEVKIKNSTVSSALHRIRREKWT